MENKKLWYAILEGEEDNDWGMGSFDREEALTKCIQYGYKLVAVIDGNYNEDGEAQSDPICVNLLYRGTDFDTGYDYDKEDYDIDEMADEDFEHDAE